MIDRKMIPLAFETKSTSRSYAKSETESGSETESDSVSSSVSSNPQDGARLEPRKKLKGLRSIRLLRLSSMRSSIKGAKSRHENIDSQSSGRISSVEMSDSSPNYMKATSSSHAKESFQSSGRKFTRKNLTRTPTLKLRRSLTRKLSGGTELKRKLRSSRSIKLTSVNGLRSSRLGKSHPNENSQRIMTRRLSFKLSNRNMFRSRRVSQDEISQISQSSDSSLHKATCSSTLKDSHFSDKIKLPLEGNGSEEVLSTKKVCPYTYCSLHGRHRDNVPPLKRVVSMRRRQMKNQKNTKMESRPFTGSKHSRNIKKTSQSEEPSRDLPVDTHNAVASTFNGGGINEILNFRCNDEVLPSETSSPHGSFDQDLNGSIAETGYALSSTVTYKDKPNSELIEIASNNNIVAACDKCDESTQSVPMDDPSDIIKSQSRLLEDADLFDKHSSLIDDSEVADPEVLGVEASQDKQEKGNSTLELNGPESAGESLNADGHGSAGDQSLEKLTESDQNIVVELTSTSEATCSSSQIHTLEEEVTIKDTSPQGESKPAASSADASYKMPEGDKKYVKMWHLMYKHAELGNAEKGEDKLQSDQEDKKAQGKDGLSSDSDDENENVVKLVQKAFDEILLPEMEDTSFGMASDDDLSKKSQDKERDERTSTSVDCPQEEARLKVDEGGENASQKMENKPESKTPKSWSRLKKVLLLKRFVKAIDEVRKINFKKPRHLPSDANLEVGKVHLRRLIPGEGKNVEEWMLDYALQKVISKLAPAQKQRVALLVEAFETVLPFQDGKNAPLSSAAFKTQATAVQRLDGSSDLGEEPTVRERESDISAKLLPDKAFHSHKNFQEHADDASDKSMGKPGSSDVVEEAKINPTSISINGDLVGKQSLAGKHDMEVNNIIVNDKDNVYLAETKDSASLSSGMLVDNMSTSLKEDVANDMVSGVSPDKVSVSTAEMPTGDSELHGSKESLSTSKSLLLKSFARALGSSLVPSSAPSDQFDESVVGSKESIVKADPEIENLEEFPPAEGTINQQEKQNHTGLWFLIYRRMASGIAENDFKPLVRGDNKEEQGYDNSRVAGTDLSISHGSIPVASQDMPLRDHPVIDSQTELHKLEAIRIVEEAIDAILPDAQEYSHDGQSVTDNDISDTSKQSHGVEGTNSEDLYQKEDRVMPNTGVTQEQDEEPALKEGNKPLSRSWSNLKKVIMLRRFIKALEKVKKFNPRGPRYLPAEPDPEAEKVNLRHQDMGERKGSEEWMLDHALRQVVSQLTPARKRKVGLLVEAFETVMPTIKN